MRISHIAPFAVSAAPAEAGHDMNAGAADTVTAYIEGRAHFGLISLIANVLCGLSVVGRGTPTTSAAGG